MTSDRPPPPGEAHVGNPGAEPFTRREVSFTSQGVRCAATLFLPAHLEAGARVPGVAMAGAIAFTKEMFLPAFASDLAAAGYAALTFDYRCLGASDGEPRGQIFPADQEEDLRNALSFLAGCEEVDPERLAIWGISLGGGVVLPVAAYDPRVRAVASIVPSISSYDGMAQAMGSAGVRGFLGTLDGDRDLRYRTGRGATIPLTTADGTPSLAPDPSIHAFYTEAAAEMAPAWRNEITIASIEKLLAYRPGSHAHLIAPTPLLMVVAEQDKVLPAHLAFATFEAAGEPKRLEVLACDHADVYRGAWRGRVHEAVVAWFAEHLGAGTRTSAPETSRPSEPAALVRLFYETFDREGPARAAAYLHSESRTYFSGAPAVVRDAWVAASNAFHGAFAGFTHGVAEQVTEGDRVVTRGVMRGRHVGTFQGVHATDREVAFGWMAMLRVVDAQVVEQRIEMDVIGLMQQLTAGAQPTGPQG